MLAKAELNYYPEEVLEKEDSGNQRQNRNRKNNRRRNRKNRSLKIASIIFAVLLMVSCLLILKRYVNITRIRMEVTELERHKTELEKEKVALTAELEGAKNSLKISKDAINKLGMSYPVKDQIVYISVDDNIEKKVTVGRASKYWDKVMNVFSRFF